jgi:hypothetical protein
MSLDSIVTISIDTQSVQMEQAGFGTPLIIARHDVWSERVKTFSNLSDLPTPDAKDPTKKGFALDSPLYRMAQALMSQNPKVAKAKIGTRLKEETVEAALNAIMKEDADFYGVLLINEHGNAADKYIADLKSLVLAVKTKRLLAGADITEEQLKAISSFDDLSDRRLFTVYKTKADDHPAAAWMGKMLPHHPGSASWAFKQLEGVKKDKLNADVIDKLKKAHINRHIDINDVGVTMDGKVMSKEYIDIVHGIDWLHVRIQERLFRLLMINEKIPYTLKGVDLVRSEIMTQLKEAVYRGLLAADPEPIVSIPNIDDIDPIARGQRKLPDVRFSGRLAGAIHEIEIRGFVGP